jgi:hypothetical protein
MWIISESLASYKRSAPTDILRRCSSTNQVFQNLPARPVSIPWKVIGWSILVGLGVFYYIYISNALRHDMFAFTEFIGPFPIVFFVMLRPMAKEGRVLKRWLGCLIAFAFCLFMFISVARSYPT